MTFSIEPARPTDLDQLVELESALFLEDAGVHEPEVDVTWPQREGHADFERLLDDESSIVLTARDDERIVGYLAGYMTGPSPTRPVTTAFLRSLYVRPSERRAGVAASLINHFVRWATDNGCANAHVDSYAANEPAQRVYERVGFTIQSISRVRPLR